MLLASRLGLEPRMLVLETKVLPLHHRDILERDRRIELLALAWKAKVLPLYESRLIFVSPGGYPPLPPARRAFFLN